jgi:hypothetical protein
MNLEREEIVRRDVGREVMMVSSVPFLGTVGFVCMETHLFQECFDLVEMMPVHQQINVAHGAESDLAVDEFSKGGAFEGDDRNPVCVKGGQDGSQLRKPFHIMGLAP